MCGERDAMSDSASQLVYSYRAGLSECDPERVDLLGGKGASLAALSRAGFFVPPGFTITTRGCIEIQAAAGKWPDDLWPQIEAAMRQLERDTGRQFGAGDRSLLVAVRSGAAVSMPGMMDTILNCGLQPGLISSFASPVEFWLRYGEYVRQFAASVHHLKLTTGSIDPHADRQPTTAALAEQLARQFLDEYRMRVGESFPVDPWQALRASIGAVFASWNSERARVYRRHHELSDAIGTAVNVQMMFPSERSGVLFTAHPQRPDAGELLIEASWGLGEAVVSGAVTPDIYVLDRASLQIKEQTAGQRPSDEPALTAKQLQELGELGIAVERFYGRPCDLEWGFADGQLALLQARAIRGLDSQRDLQRIRAEELERLRSLSAGRATVWVAHNLGETLPAPTPLTWTILREFMSGAGGFGELYRLLGFHPSQTIAKEGFLELVFGRVYCDPHRAAQLFFDEIPFEYRVDEIAADPRVVDAPPRHLNLERADPWLFLRLPRLAWRLLRAARLQKSLRKSMLTGTAECPRFQLEVVQAIDRFLGNELAIDLRRLSIDDLLKTLNRRRQFVFGRFAAETLLPGYLGGLAQTSLHNRLVQYLGEHEGTVLTEQLTSGHGDITVEQNQALYDVAQGRLQVREFLDRFGHRAAQEMELSRPRWREDLATVEQMVNRLRQVTDIDPATRCQRQHQLSAAAEQTLMERLADQGASAFYEEVMADLRAARRLLPYRELGKFHLLRGYATIRDVIEQLAQRWELGGGIYFLEVDELPWYEQNPKLSRERIAGRQNRWKAFQKTIIPDMIDSRELGTLLEQTPTKRTADGTPQWEARAIAGGQAEGLARIVRDPNQVSDLGEGYVLVCPSTDPGWTPLFVGARALIVERGGVLSHGAIVARDFGIPAVVCANAATIFVDGMRLRVDADHGVVQRLDSPSTPPAPVETRRS